MFIMFLSLTIDYYIAKDILYTPWTIFNSEAFFVPKKYAIINYLYFLKKKISKYKYFFSERQKFNHISYCVVNI